MSTYYVGIDPGRAGAVAIIDETGTYVRAFPMPEPRILFLELSRRREALSEMLVVIEDAPTFGGMGQKGDPEKAQQGARTAAVQQRNVGQVVGVVACTGLPYRLVPPITWKSAMHLTLNAEDRRILPENATRDQRTQLLKGKSLEMARNWFPDAPLKLQKDEAKAEALLLAEWLRRKEQQRGFPTSIERISRV